MKNVDLSTGWTADELHEDNKSPGHLSMRKHLTKKTGRTGRYEYMWPDGSFTKQGRLYRYIPRLLKKNIGKSFDAVFSKFCLEYPEVIGGLNTREVFKNHFNEYKPYSGRWMHTNNFFIDSQGRIQCEQSKRRRKQKGRLEFWDEEPSYYYALNKDYLRRHHSVDNALYNIIGKELYYYINDTEKIPEKVVSKIRTICLQYRNTYDRIINSYKNDTGEECVHITDILDSLFHRKTDASFTTIIKGDDAYTQYRAEQSDLKKRRQREYQEEQKERYEAALRKLWEIQEQERKQNIIDRDRLGFDNMSFKKEKEE